MLATALRVCSAILLCVLSNADVAVYIEDDAGAIHFGAASDVSLYRKDAQTLKTINGLEVGTVAALSSVTTPSLSATTSVTTPSLFATSSVTTPSLSATVVSATTITSSSVLADTLQVGTLDVNTNVTAPQIAALSVVSSQLYVDLDAVVGSQLIATSISAQTVESVSVSVSGETVSGSIRATQNITAPVVQADALNTNQLSATTIQTTGLLINSHNAYELLVFSDKCLTDASTPPSGSTLLPTLLSIVGGADNLILVGRNYLQNSGASGVAVDDFDVIVVPKSGTYRVTVSPYICDKNATGILEVTVTRSMVTVFHQSYRPRVSSSGCGSVAVSSLWNGYQSGDAIQLKLSQSTTSTAWEQPTYPSSVVDASVDNTFAKLTVELVA